MIFNFARAAALTEDDREVEVDDVPAELSEQIFQAIADLQSDGVKFNAHEALERLQSIGPPAIPALEFALGCKDYQQRQYVATVLRRMSGYSPSARLLEVTVEGLQHDIAPLGRHGPGGNSPHGAANQLRSYNYVFNATEGTEYLLRHCQAAELYLVRGLGSRDLQQRFLCAFILGYSGRSAHSARIAEILLPHLRDNDVAGDARLAAPALYRLGPRVLPDLYAALPEADDQQQDMIELIILDLTRPARNAAERESRRRYNCISRLFIDPATDGRFIDVPSF